MSQLADIILIGESGEGFSTELLLSQLKDFIGDSVEPKSICVKVANQTNYTLVDTLEEALKGDLQKFIIENFRISPRLIFKTGSNCELMLVENPDMITDKGKFRKKRNRMAHLTPKKKKRK